MLEVLLAPGLSAPCGYSLTGAACSGRHGLVASHNAVWWGKGVSVSQIPSRANKHSSTCWSRSVFINREREEVHAEFIVAFSDPALPISAVFHVRTPRNRGEIRRTTDCINRVRAAFALGAKNVCSFL